MGAVATREEIICKLEELDKKELDLNLKLKDLQIQLNEMVPDEEKIKVNNKLTPNSKINNNYGGGGDNVDLDDDDGAKKPKKKGKKKKKKEIIIYKDIFIKLFIIF